MTSTGSRSRKTRSGRRAVLTTAAVALALGAGAIAARAPAGARMRPGVWRRALAARRLGRCVRRPCQPGTAWAIVELEILDRLSITDAIRRCRFGAHPVEGARGAARAAASRVRDPLVLGASRGELRLGRDAANLRRGRAAAAATARSIFGRFWFPSRRLRLLGGGLDRRRRTRRRYVGRLRRDFRGVRGSTSREDEQHGNESFQRVTSGRDGTGHRCGTALE